MDRIIEITQMNEQVRKRHKEMLKSLLEIGYGEMMSLASELWADSSKKVGIAGGEFVVGPCKSATVPCGCNDTPHCNWCAGSGWLTRHVKNIKDCREIEAI